MKNIVTKFSLGSIILMTALMGAELMEHKLWPTWQIATVCGSTSAIVVVAAIKIDEA